jgi:hypothetical protein
VADPVVVIKVRYENDNASLTEAARGGARAIQEGVGGGVPGGIGGGGTTAAATAFGGGLNPAARPGTNEYTMNRALHAMLGGPSQDLSYVRGQRELAINNLRDIIGTRQMAMRQFRTGAIDEEEFGHVMGQVGKDYNRERGFLNRTRTDQFRIEGRLGNMQQSAYASEEQSSAKELAAANRQLAQTAAPSPGKRPTSFRRTSPTSPRTTSVRPSGSAWARSMTRLSTQPFAGRRGRSRASRGCTAKSCPRA